MKPSNLAKRLRASLAVAGALALGAAVARWQLTRLFTEQAPYEVERRLGHIEIRKYPSIVVAQTTVTGKPWRKALGDGFRRLAGYIFGRDAPGHREHIPMTTPVFATRSGDVHDVQFFMPKGSSLESLPPPRDPRVELRTLPPRRVAVRRSHGTYRGSRVRALQRELLEEVRRAGLATRGEVGFAGYDPPSTLPLLRRVEAWVELAPDQPT